MTPRISPPGFEPWNCTTCPHNTASCTQKNHRVRVSFLWFVSYILDLFHLLSNIQYKAYQILKLKCFLSRLAAVFTQSIQARCWVENEDVVGAATTGDAPTTFEWSTIVLSTKVWVISKVWEYVIVLLYQANLQLKYREIQLSIILTVVFAGLYGHVINEYSASRRCVVVSMAKDWHSMNTAWQLYKQPFPPLRGFRTAIDDMIQSNLKYVYGFVQISKLCVTNLSNAQLIRKIDLVKHSCWLIFLDILFSSLQLWKRFYLLLWTSFSYMY